MNQESKGTNPTATCRFKYDHYTYEIIFFEPNRVQIFYLAPQSHDNYFLGNERDLVMETKWDWGKNIIEETEWEESWTTRRLHKTTFLTQATATLKKTLTKPRKRKP